MRQDKTLVEFAIITVRNNIRFQVRRAVDIASFIEGFGMPHPIEVGVGRGGKLGRQWMGGMEMQSWCAALYAVAMPFDWGM